MLDLDAGLPPSVLDGTRRVVEEFRQDPRKKDLTVPREVTLQLNAALSNAMLEDVLALRNRERSVSLEVLRMTLR
ncbi:MULTISPECIES: hypothetical protein [unclassified Delftia]|uniref:hypothetical protein n=1 Tax=unclassified Delftia TaxID=2613839 RepID=UPI001902B234|nr:MULTISPECIES: hypothetical protein [unclassified Delftia]MBK0116115.1 hypothetical protein [Delftia sp. S65]MBK0121980.1 hypothetical protein [Delftia sp. S67]MBK0132584.1 hypothetical protein [Delftia sp. S66]